MAMNDSISASSPAEPVVSTPLPIDIYYEIQQFLYHEAGLLDRRDYAAWLRVLTEDVRYIVTAKVSRDAGASEIEYAIVDESQTGLNARIAQISNARLTRAENPPSFTRRLVSNIQASPGERTGEFRVTSSFITYRVRPGAPEGGFYVGERSDLLRKSAQGWRLARRHARLDQTMIMDGALSVLL